MAKQRNAELNGIAKLYEARQLYDQGHAPDDERMATMYPQLFSLLTNNRIDEKHVCDGATLRVSNSAGDWCFSLGVTSLAMYGEIMAPTFEQGLSEVEQKLANGTFPWKPNLRKKPRTREVKGSS